MSLSVVASPMAESDLVVILSLLEAHDIPYFVHGAGTSGLFPGLQIQAMSVRRVMVPTVDVERAQEALSTLVVAPRETRTPFLRAVGDAIRVLVEFFFCGVFVPRHRSRYADEEA